MWFYIPYILYVFCQPLYYTETKHTFNYKVYSVIILPIYKNGYGLTAVMTY